MFRRRPKAESTEPDEGSIPGAGTAARDDAAAGSGSGEPTASGKPDRPNGPWDVDELDGSHTSHDVARVDLGGLRIRPLPGMQVQMQVDSATGQATSVLLAGDQAAVQLMAIAATKSSPLWPSTMSALAADATRKGGTAQEGKGPWGPVLRLAMPATTKDGSAGVQPSVVLGIDGPRWMLRATMIGRAAIDQETMNQMMGIVQHAVVVRGQTPMPPGEIIVLTPPTRPDEPEPPAGGDDAADQATPAS